MLITFLEQTLPFLSAFVSLSVAFEEEFQIPTLYCSLANPSCQPERKKEVQQKEMGIKTTDTPFPAAVAQRVRATGSSGV